eukprot:gnl/TRDRNA2_/TRDRNA2_171571_c7_seq1.p2 gnl/TRDRNA2_/TRDRNA2_171571_c7~~gnl/TRDRNA2_/TRDRNA2_171571_c7_seq1.p2  ORF type:complete len:103 (-),score=4.99 gnl/TRDRNA2_/TRDRNA2_171571_c7_seq1:613-921(-)
MLVRSSPLKLLACHSALRRNATNSGSSQAATDARAHAAFAKPYVVKSPVSRYDVRASAAKSRRSEQRTRAKAQAKFVRLWALNMHMNSCDARANIENSAPPH